MPETTLAPTDVRRGTYLTADDLRAWGASCRQVARVEALWPEGTELTLEALERAAEEGLDMDWFAQTGLGATASLGEYPRAVTLAREEFRRVAAAPLQSCQHAIGLARGRYLRSVYSAEAEYDYLRATAAAHEEYRRATALALEDCRRAVARALWDALPEPDPEPIEVTP